MAQTALTHGRRLLVAAADSAIDLRGQPIKRWAIQVKGEGAAATTWSVNVEGSLDGTNFTSLLTHANADVDGTVKFDTADKPISFVRINVTSLVLGPATALLVTVAGA